MSASLTILQQQTVAETPTDWSETIPFNQFDPSQGTLQSVDVGLTADLAGSVSIESLEAAPSTVLISQSGNISVASPAGVQLADATPYAFASAELGAYDGTTDYAGASGTVVALSNAATVESAFSAAVSGIGGFVGTGSVPLSAAASTALDVQGPANMQIQSEASAGATIDLQYNYTAPAVGGSSGSSSTGSGSTEISVNLPPSFDNAATTAPQIVTVADSTTGSSHQLIVNQFNPALGILVGIDISLSGDLSTSVAAENEDATSAIVTTSQVGTETLALPGATEVTSAETGSSADLGGYDGTANFEGTSATIVQSQTSMPTTTETFTDATDLAAFTGTGTVATTISSSSTGTLEGPGNLLARLTAEAGATVAVSYVYVPTGVSVDAIGWWNQSGGAWAEGPNWTSYYNPPASSDDVAITQPGTYAVTLAAAETIHSIVIDSPDATLVLDGDLTATGNVVLDAGTIDFNGGTVFAGEFVMNGGLMTGTTVAVNSAGSIVLNAGSVVAADLVDFASAEAMTGAPTVVVETPELDLTPALDLTAECFARGSRIATPRGAVRVEKLAVGDSVLLASGGTAPIVWIGHREIDCRRHPEPGKVWPVRIRRNAFGEGRPHRDLLLSPDHAVFADEVLIPVKYLINGTTIRQVRSRSIGYFHIELDRHEVVLAEGLPVETYLDVGNRNNFANNPGAVALHPDFWWTVWQTKGYAPLVFAGPQVVLVKRKINAIALMAA